MHHQDLAVEDDCGQALEPLYVGIRQSLEIAVHSTGHSPILQDVRPKRPGREQQDVVVADEHVHPPVALFHRADHGLDAVPLGDVGADDGGRGGAAALGLGRHLLALPLVDLGDGQVHAFAREGQADGAADIGAAAGDDDALPRQVQFHRRSPQSRAGSGIVTTRWSGHRPGTPSDRS